MSQFLQKFENFVFDELTSSIDIYKFLGILFEKLTDLVGSQLAGNARFNATPPAKQKSVYKKLESNTTILLTNNQNQYIRT